MYNYPAIAGLVLVVLIAIANEALVGVMGHRFGPILVAPAFGLLVVRTALLAGRTWGLTCAGLSITYIAYILAVPGWPPTWDLKALSRFTVITATYVSAVYLIHLLGERKLQSERLLLENKLLAKHQEELEHRNRQIEALVEARTQELACRTRQLEEAQAVANMGSWEMDLRTAQEVWSPQLYRIYGMDPECNTLPADHHIEFTHPADRAEVTSVVRQAFQEGGRFDIRRRVLRPDGALRMVHTQGEITCDDRGEPSRVIGTAQDITERFVLERAAREQETRLHFLVEHTSDVIFIVDREGRCDFVNRAGAMLIGLEPYAIIGQRYDALLPREAAERIGASLRQVLENGRPFQSDETIVDATGQVRYYMVHHFPYLSPEGELAGVVGIGRDITERVQAELVLAESHARLQALDKMKDEIVSAVSHDLRTPLSAVKGYLEFLEDELAGPLTAEQRDYVANIRIGSERLQRLIDDLLDFALLEAGELMLLKEPFDLVSTTRRTVGFLEPLASEREVSLSLQSEFEELSLAGDSARIEQVLINLIGNAIKFTPPGGQVRLLIKSHGPAVRVEVRDTGPGVPEESLPRLFDKFFRERDSRTRGGVSAGLGLAIAKQLIEAHDGQIGVESTLGAGSTFWFLLPRH